MTNPLDVRSLCIANAIGLGPNDERPHEPEDQPYLFQRSEHDVVEGEVHGRFVPSYPGYFDAYRRGAASLHLHIGVSYPRGECVPEDFCVLVEKLTPPEPELTLLHPATEGREFPGAEATADRDHLSMLVRVFETAQDADDVQRGLRTLVRLRTEDDCERLRSLTEAAQGALEVFPRFTVWVNPRPIGASLERVVIGDGERGILAVPWWRTRDDDLIERTAEVVYEVTKNGDEHRIQLLETERVSPLATLSAWISETDNRVRVTLGIQGGIVPEFHHVMLGALELDPPRINHSGTSG